VNITGHDDVPGIRKVVYIGSIHQKKKPLPNRRSIPHVSSSSDSTPVRHFLSHHPALIAGASAKSEPSSVCKVVGFLLHHPAPIAGASAKPEPSSVSKVVGLLSYHPALIAGASVQTRTFIRCKDTSMISHDNRKIPKNAK
jgi:hypothetical protein